MHCRGFCHQWLATLPEMVCVVFATDAGLLFPVSQQVVLQLQGRTWAPADKGCLWRRHPGSSVCLPEVLASCLVGAEQDVRIHQMQLPWQRPPCSVACHSQTFNRLIFGCRAGHGDPPEDGRTGRGSHAAGPSVASVRGGGRVPAHAGGGCSRRHRAVSPSQPPE